jgi:hypothetical protein
VELGTGVAPGVVAAVALGPGEAAGELAGPTLGGTLAPADGVPKPLPGTEGGGTTVLSQATTRKATRTTVGSAVANADSREIIQSSEGSG